MSACDNDHRVQPHPDGSWMVFNNDYTAEYMVRQNRAEEWDSRDASGYPILSACGKATKDDAIRALIGDPR